ncbi:MAG: FMN-dependent NADH-azoreductase, partial [Pseudoalteromonas spongiae]
SHLTPHIQTLSKYLGVQVMFEIASEYQEFNDKRHQDSVTKAHHDAVRLAKTLSTQRQEIQHASAI